MHERLSPTGANLVLLLLFSFSQVLEAAEQGDLATLCSLFEQEPQWNKARDASANKLYLFTSVMSCDTWLIHDAL